MAASRVSASFSNWGMEAPALLGEDPPTLEAGHRVLDVRRKPPGLPVAQRDLHIGESRVTLRHFQLQLEVAMWRARTALTGSVMRVALQRSLRRRRQDFRVAIACSQTARILAGETLTAFWPSESVSQRPR